MSPPIWPSQSKNSTRCFFKGTKSILLLRLPAKKNPLESAPVQGENVSLRLGEVTQTNFQQNHSRRMWLIQRGCSGRSSSEKTGGESCCWASALLFLFFLSSNSCASEAKGRGSFLFIYHFSSSGYCVLSISVSSFKPGLFLWPCTRAAGHQGKDMRKDEICNKHVERCVCDSTRDK